MDPVLVLRSGTTAVELSRDDVLRLTSDAAAARGGRFGQGMPAVLFSQLRDVLGDAGADARYATFLAADGYAASIELSQADADGIVLLPEEGKTGVRLVVDSGGSACFNVKAVTAIELTQEMGKHTVDPNPHENQPVPGWDR